MVYNGILTERRSFLGNDHGSVHGSFELPASIEPLETCDGLLPVHGRRYSVTILEERGGRGRGREGEGGIKGGNEMEREGQSESKESERRRKERREGGGGGVYRGGMEETRREKIKWKERGEGGRGSSSHTNQSCNKENSTQD